MWRCLKLYQLIYVSAQDLCKPTHLYPYRRWCWSWFFLRFYLFIFRERGREREIEGEKRQCVVAFHMPPTRELAHSPGMCPDWESNQWPFGSQADTQSTEPHQPGMKLIFNCIVSIIILSLSVIYFCLVTLFHICR